VFNRSGLSALPLCACLFLLVLSLSGCGKIKSAYDSLLGRHHPAEARHPARAPHPQVSAAHLAVILDDVASDPSSVDAIFSLHYPLTLSVLPNHPRSAQIAQEAHRRGYQVMLHLPMESLANETPEPQELRPGMSSAQISSALNAMLATVPDAVGVNNHQGSLATSNPQLMADLMPLLHSHHLFFIDSRTTAATTAYERAQSAGVPSSFRNVPFLDDVPEVGAVRHQLELAFKEAREKHEAIAIGHPHPETLRALAELLPQAESHGIRLVHASDLVH
jgi:polysaccharide deacetylase 2 family uncharacterized protein YibQ